MSYDNAIGRSLVQRPSHDISLSLKGSVLSATGVDRAPRYYFSRLPIDFRVGSRSLIEPNNRYVDDIRIRQLSFKTAIIRLRLNCYPPWYALLTA